MTMKMLVTGAAGFIGSNLVDRLLADGHEVVGVDDLSTGKLANLEAASAAASYRFDQIDITTPEFVAVVGEVAPEVIFHLAAQVDVRISVADPLFDARLNILGTINVCEAARLAGVRKVVFTSSGGTIYGSPDQLPVTESAPVNPLSPYAIGKVTGELYLAAYLEMYGLDWTSLAFGNVYGPRQNPHGEAGVVAIFGTAMLEGRPTKIFGDGTATRDYVFIDDAVTAFVLAGSAGGGRRLNVGSGIETSVLDVYRVVAGAVGAPDEPILAPARTGELQAISLDATAARDVLGWTPQTDFTTGVAATVAWLKTTLT
jgi:UDP-glucose 4-epimerase